MSTTTLHNLTVRDLKSRNRKAISRIKNYKNDVKNPVFKNLFIESFFVTVDMIKRQFDGTDFGEVIEVD